MQNDDEKLKNKTICIKIFPDYPSAGMAKSKLESNNIKSFIMGIDSSQPFLEYNQGVRLCVNSNDAEKAKEILSDYP